MTAQAPLSLIERLKTIWSDEPLSGEAAQTIKDVVSFLQGIHARRLMTAKDKHLFVDAVGLRGDFVTPGSER